MLNKNTSVKKKVPNTITNKPIPHGILQRSANVKPSQPIKPSPKAQLYFSIFSKKRQGLLLPTALTLRRNLISITFLPGTTLLAQLRSHDFHRSCGMIKHQKVNISLEIWHLRGQPQEVFSMWSSQQFPQLTGTGVETSQSETGVLGSGSRIDTSNRNKEYYGIVYVIV